MVGGFDFVGNLPHSVVQRLVVQELIDRVDQIWGGKVVRIDSQACARLHHSPRHIVLITKQWQHQRNLAQSKSLGEAVVSAVPNL